MHRIYNLSLDSRTFPSRWKLSYLTPIHKSGSRSDVKNYREIAILATLGKVFEAIVCQRLTADLRSRITVKQHGFEKGRSTTTNLMNFVGYVLNKLERGSQVDAIYTDIRKVFDQISHSYLIRKLSQLGIQSACWIWLVPIYEIESSTSRSQGMSPTRLKFYLAYQKVVTSVHDVETVLKKAKCSSFADDLILYHSINSLLDATDLQSDIEAFSTWCNKNSLSVNVDKCKIMSFYRKKSPTSFSFSIGDIALNECQ